MSHATPKRWSENSLQVWTLVARRGMTADHAARALSISPRRVERILIGVSRRNAQKWQNCPTQITCK